MDSRVRERRRLVNRERGRRRAGPIFVCALLVVALVAFLWLRSSSVFAVETITASAIQHVTQKQISDAVANARGASLLKLSTGDIEQALGSLPYVRSIHVYRDFPNALRIDIDEYEPEARLQDGNGDGWLVAGDGHLLQKAGPSAAQDLPLIVAAARFEAKVGSIVPQAVLGAMPVARLLVTSEMAAQLPAVDRVSVSTGGDVVVVLEDGTELRLGEPTDLKQKMTVAAKLVQTYLRDGKALEYVDVSAGDRAAVKPK